MEPNLSLDQSNSIRTFPSTYSPKHHSGRFITGNETINKLDRLLKMV